MFVLKNHCAPQLRETNSRARLSHPKQLLSDVSIIFVTVENIYSATLKNVQNDQLYTHASTNKKEVATKHLRIQLTFSH